ncbi:MAG: LamG domain-containing protein, partial [Bacteroidota bacterium]
MLPFFIYAQIPSGAVAKYELNTNATDIGGNNYNGTLTSTANTTDRFGTANSALAFTAGTSTGTLPSGLATAMQTDFSLGYWFKTTMIANSSTQWYGGNALLDAEVCGNANDWGTALIDGGKVSFGIGNTDITIKSPSASYNDGNWHFVTATRNASAGTIILYVDGVSVASTAGTNTSALNAPVLIGLGRNPCNAGGVFTGSLDDIIAYNRVLTATEVNNLYVFLSAFTLPVKWLSFTGEFAGKNIILKWEVEQTEGNDHFEAENSSDGIHFSMEGIIQSKDGVSSGSGKEMYHFSSTNPSAGTHFYRIRQVDKDGNYSYSKTIKLVPNSIARG